MLVAGWLFLHSRHFTAGEVSTRAMPAHGVEMQQLLAGNGVEYYGKLRLDIYIASDGSVERIDTEGSTVPEAFRKQAVQAFTSVGWEPARKWGIKVASVKRVEVDFEAPASRPGNANVSPAGS